MDPVADRLQFEMQELRDRVSRLEALLLPQEPIQAVPQPPPIADHVSQVTVAQEIQPQVTAIPDISVGWVASGRK